MISDRYMMDCAALAFNTPGITPAFSKGLHASVTVEHLHHFARLVTDAATASLHARIAELEAQLYAIGAGGVGQSIKPAVQADTAQEPVAWRVRPFDYGIGYEGVDALTTRKEQCEMWERKGWKVEPLYAAPQPARQPLTEDELKAAAGLLIESLNPWMVAFARSIEAAHGITESQP